MIHTPSPLGKREPEGYRVVQKGYYMEGLIMEFVLNINIETPNKDDYEEKLKKALQGVLKKMDAGYKVFDKMPPPSVTGNIFITI